MANEVIGSWQCDAGGSADVMQTKRRGHHLYTNCKCCGVDQRTGAQRQTKLWNEAKFFPGVTVKKPANVTEQTEHIGSPGPEALGPVEPDQAKPEPETGGDFDPTEGDSQTEDRPEPGRSWPRLLAGMTLLGSAVGGWLWTRK